MVRGEHRSVRLHVCYNRSVLLYNKLEPNRTEWITITDRVGYRNRSVLSVRFCRCYRLGLLKMGFKIQAHRKYDNHKFSLHLCKNLNYTYNRTQKIANTLAQRLAYKIILNIQNMSNSTACYTNLQYTKQQMQRIIKNQSPASQKKS